MKGIKEYVLAFNLALGPVVWFMDFSFGFVKMTLFILLVILNISIFRYQSTYRFLPFFLLLFILLSISIFQDWNFELDKFIILFTFLQNFYFFILGLFYSRNNFVTISLIRKIIGLISVFCFLTISDFIFHFPDWIQPFQLEKIRDLENLGVTVQANPLHVTGFGLGRTGWATSIAQFLPLALLLRNSHKKLGNMGFIILICSILFTGARGGLVIAILILTIFIIKQLSISRQILIFLLVALSLLYLFGDESSFIYEYYRLNSGDLSTGRGMLYAFVPQMIMEGGLLGLGYEGSLAYFSSNLHQNLELHNVYLRMMIDHGILVGLLIIIISVFMLKRFMNILKYERDDIHFYGGLLIVVGLIAGLLEPSAMYSARYWWVPFWFFVGVTSYNKKS